MIANLLISHTVFGWVLHAYMDLSGDKTGSELASISSCPPLVAELEKERGTSCTTLQYLGLCPKTLIISEL